MVRIKQLLDDWEDRAATDYTAQEFCLRLPVPDAARICALADMYPGRTREQIIVDLLGVALKELEEAMPYVAGDKVIARDECGDPIYEDIGLTPRFQAQTEQHLRQLQSRATPQP